MSAVGVWWISMWDAPDVGGGGGGELVWKRELNNVFLGHSHAFICVQNHYWTAV